MAYFVTGATGFIGQFLMRNTSLEKPVSRSTALMLNGVIWPSRLIDLSWTKRR